MDIKLPPDASQFIRGMVESGQYATADEVVADGVRLLMTRHQLRAEIQKGINELDDGQGIERMEVFADLRDQAQKLIKQSG